jgi:hypothetical protein
MKKHRLQDLLRNAILAVLIFTFVSEPILVAAKSLQSDPQSQAIDLALQGGERYLDSISTATVESAKLIDYISVVQSTPLSQLNEAYIEDVIDRTLDMAEQTSVALGAVDDLADGIEQIGDNLPVGVDIGQTIGDGIPDEMRAELIAQGVSSEQVDQISASASNLFSARQSAASGLPADLQADLLSHGFTQTEIDEIADAVAQHGLVNNSLNTRLAQFRATQDELANARSNMLILAVQLLGYQIAVRQSNGIQPRAATTVELEALSEDELRILIHAAHLNAMWGSDPSAEIGEGDWWFIEHFAERAADRLQVLIVETQNRGLVAELFVIRQMKMLAVSAHTGDADYAKAELEALVGLLAYNINATAYYQQHASAALPELALARVVATPSLRENVEWPVSSSAIKTARIASMEQMEFVGVQDLDSFLGNFDESNETNNQAGILFLAGIPFFGNLPLDILQPSLQILSTTTLPASFAWLEAILTGNTDDPALLVVNVLLSIIPILGAIPDLISLAYDQSYFVKAASIFGIIGSVGDITAVLGLPEVAVGTFAGDVAAAVIKYLFKLSDLDFRGILNALSVAENFEIIKGLMKTALLKFGGSLGNTWNAIEAALSSISVWDDFVAFVSKAKAGLLLEIGFDEGSALVGGIIRRGADLTDTTIIKSLDDIFDDLVKKGIKLSDEAADGLWRATKLMDGDELKKFISKIGTQAQLEKNLRFIKELDSSAEASAKILTNTIGGENLAVLVTRYVDTPADLTNVIFKNLGDAAVNSVAIEAAMKQGPEAVRAFAGWGDILKNNDKIAQNLAKRATKDAATLALLKNWSYRTMPSLNDLVAIGKNSRDGVGAIWALGPDAKSYTSGFVDFARSKNAQFYYTHPEFGKAVKDIFPDIAEKTVPEADEIFWTVNQVALDGAGGPINTGMDFVYQTNAVDEGLIIEIFENGRTYEEIINLPGGKAFSIKELFLLRGNGYDIGGFDALGNYIFKQTP